ncbi:MAG: hypothetical protein EOO67_06240 [Microbacterium sp.]|nr:MAG: hypothetical protein EOO67_06240 [Microbacterium sp.]
MSVPHDTLRGARRGPHIAVAGVVALALTACAPHSSPAPELQKYRSGSGGAIQIHDTSPAGTSTTRPDMASRQGSQ